LLHSKLKISEKVEMEPPSAAKVNKEQLCALPYPDPLGFDFSMGFSEK